MRFAASREGVEILSKQGIVLTMIEAFLKFTENTDINDARFLVSLIKSFK